MEKNEEKEMHLKQNDSFVMRGDNYPKDSMFYGVSVFIRNNGENVVKVVTDGTNLMINVEKSEQ